MIWRSLSTVVYPTTPPRAARSASCTSRTVLGPRCHSTPRMASSALVGRIISAKYERLRTCQYDAFRTSRSGGALHVGLRQHHAMPPRDAVDRDPARLDEPPHQLSAPRGGRGRRGVDHVALEQDPGGGDVDREHPFGVCGGQAVRNDLPVTPRVAAWHRSAARERRWGRELQTCYRTARE